MNNGRIGVICGSDNAATTLALGRAVEALTQQKHVIVIRFLNSSQDSRDWSQMKRLEPELKLFSFERSMGAQEEVHLSIINGLNFAKKVMATGECDVLILDGVLDLLEEQVVNPAEIKSMLSADCEVEILFTGGSVPAGMESYIRSIERIEEVHVDKAEQ